MIDASVGTSTANSYVTVAEGDTYFGGVIGKGAWNTASLALKESALISATQSIENFFLWEGYAASETQTLGWPRTYTMTTYGVPYASTIIPRILKNAVMELALVMLQSGNNISFDEQVVDSVKVGSIAVKFTAGTSVDSGMPDFIERMLQHLGASIVPGKGVMKMARLVRT